MAGDYLKDGAIRRSPDGENLCDWQAVGGAANLERGSLLRTALLATVVTSRRKEVVCLKNLDYVRLMARYRFAGNFTPRRSFARL